ncbi:MAG TPA: hypothetical protein VG498_25790, partial [Terriglobales bacterium]|nr:hypothetical protein [Terriglobales bacterium]
MCNKRTLKPLTPCRLFAYILALATLSGSTLIAQDSASAPPLLSLNEAIQLALANNRSIKVAGFEVDKSKWQIAE